MSESRCVFPASDQLPVGRAYGRTDSTPAAPTRYRPFGLRLSRRPLRIVEFDPDTVVYDPHRQIGMVRAPGGMVPLARHTDGQTNTKTNADGHQGTDSDTDQRED